jgi:hypothetical protein
MKKLLIMACICAGFALTGCSSDNDENTPANPLTIDARVENGNDYNSQIDSVRAFVNDDDTQVVATAKYVNGGFTITLPANIDSKYFSFSFVDLPSGLTVSDKNAKYTVIDAYGFIGVKSGQIVSEFQYINNFFGYDLVSANFFYADRNVTISGTYTENNGNVNVWDNVSLKKGWNTVYYTVIHHDDYTTTTTNSNTKPDIIKWRCLLYLWT